MGAAARPHGRPAAVLARPAPLALASCLALLLAHMPQLALATSVGAPGRGSGRGGPGSRWAGPTAPTPGPSLGRSARREGRAGAGPRATMKAPAGPARYLVEFHAPCMLDDGLPDGVEQHREAFLQGEACRHGVARVLHNYTRVFSGVAVVLRDGTSAAALASDPCVKAVHRVGFFAHPRAGRMGRWQSGAADSHARRALLKAGGGRPTPMPALEEIGADVAHRQGITGKGVRIGVVDSGIDYDHPALGGGCFGRPECVVVGGWDFVGDSPDVRPGANRPDSDPDDQAGHGTHVAGILAANGGGLVGVAPGAKLYAYKVFTSTGSGGDDATILAALERASRDAVDILNLSLGTAFDSTPTSVLAAAAAKLVRGGKGIKPVVVVAAAGNEASSGLFSVNPPGVGLGVISVASSNPLSRLQPLIRVEGSAQPIGYLPCAQEPTFPRLSSMPLVAAPSAGEVVIWLCLPLPPGALRGKAVLLHSGGICDDRVRAYFAQRAGASAVLLVSEQPGAVPSCWLYNPDVTIPVVAVTREDGSRIFSLVRAGGRSPVAMTWTREWRLLDPPGNDRPMSFFSSLGLAADLTLKPAITAPGASIMSTWPLEGGNLGSSDKGGRYQLLSGTSMATPHVAGAAALLLQARPRMERGHVLAALQNVAEPLTADGDPASASLAPVHQQGAGMLRIDQALANRNVLVTPSSLSLGESQAGPATHTLKVANTGKKAVTFTVSHQPALASAAKGPLFRDPSTSARSARAEFSASKVTVKPMGSAWLNVTIAAPARLPDLALYGGYIVLTSKSGTTLRVPYAGLKGDYQSVAYLPATLSPELLANKGLKQLAFLAPIFKAVAKGARLPLLASWRDGAIVPVAPKTRFDMDGDDPLSRNVFIVLRFALPPAGLRVEYLDAATRRVKASVTNALLSSEFGGSLLGLAPVDGWGEYAFMLNGTATNAKGAVAILGSGSYVARLSVLNQLGRWSNPDHVETWESPAFIMKRRS